MISLSDVAKQAGVSKGTVSRVLNNKGYISQKTKDKVYLALKALNYNNDTVGISKLKTRFNTIGLLVPDLVYPHFSKLAMCIEKSLSKRGYRMVLCSTLNSKNLGIDNLELFKHGEIDGLILCNRSVSDEELETLKRPIVSIDRYAHPGISTVSSDHPVSGEIVAKYLIERGCKHVLQTVGTGSQGSPWNERHEVFERVLKENGVKCHTHYREVLCISDMELNHKLISEQMKMYPDIDGYFGNDFSCVAAIEEAKKLGRRIPEDFQIVSTDGSYICENYSPKITSIVQPVENIAEWAVDTLCKLIDDPTIECCNIQLKSTFVERETTKKINK